jgi:hypothetical protein
LEAIRKTGALPAFSRKPIQAFFWRAIGEEWLGVRSTFRERIKNNSTDDGIGGSVEKSCAENKNPSRKWP